MGIGAFDVVGPGGLALGVHSTIERLDWSRCFRSALPILSVINLFQFYNCLVGICI